MELRQLEYLVAVAEEASFTRAAERVHISQSGVSAQIRELERDLGATLFDRGRTATPTDAGRAAVKHAREVLAAAATLRQAVNEISGVISGHLTVGMVTACTVTGLFEAMAAFHTDHPGVTMTLLEDDSAALADRVRAGAADVALIGATSAESPGLPSLPVTTERLVAAANHFPERISMTLPALAGFPLICMPQGTGIRSVFDEACAARGLRLDIALEASAPSTAADLAARGLGVAILSESMAAAYPGLEAQIIEDIESPALLTLVWRPAPSPAAEAFLRCCRAAFAPH
jgi:DNA-binding transcriptional LysR family regulator